jgi:hypothetical protein
MAVLCAGGYVALDAVDALMRSRPSATPMALVALGVTGVLAARARWRDSLSAITVAGALSLIAVAATVLARRIHWPSFAWWPTACAFALVLPVGREGLRGAEPLLDLHPLARHLLAAAAIILLGRGLRVIPLALCATVLRPTAQGARPMSPRVSIAFAAAAAVVAICLHRCIHTGDATVFWAAAVGYE